MIGLWAWVCVPWLSTTRNGVGGACVRARVCACVYVFYFLSRCMRPEGPWQRLATALADSSLFYLPLYDRILSPTTMGYTGASFGVIGDLLFHFPLPFLRRHPSPLDVDETNFL